jgi:hypothetical protein
MRRSGGCLGCLFKLIVLPILMGAVVCVVIAVLNPWALHMGGRATPLMYWQGTGTVVSKDGKTYPLYVFFLPGTGASRLHREGLRPNSGLQGTGELCTGPGQTQMLKLSGTMYGGYSSTEGSLMDFRLFEWKIFDPQMRKGYFDLAGNWRGGELVMDRPLSQSRVFLSGVRIQDATATLRWGTKDEFEAACRGMGSGAGR